MRTQSICLALATVLLCPFASAQWVQTNGPNGGSVYCFAVSGTNLFAGTQGGGAFLSTNNGTSWTATGLTNTHVFGLAVSGANLFAGTYELGGAVRSTDNGASWNPAVEGLTKVTWVRVFAITGVKLFAGTDNGVFVSTNNGTNWALSGLVGENIYCLAVSGTDLFAGSNNGYGGGALFLFTNNDTNWTRTGLGTNITSFESIPSEPAGTNLIASVFALSVRKAGHSKAYTEFGTSSRPAPNVRTAFSPTDYYGVVLSTDNGTSWAKADSGLTGATVTCFAVSGKNLFAGTWNSGIFLSTNNGTTWTAVNSALEDTSVSTLAVSGTNLYAGTYAGGIWRRPLAEMITGINTSSVQTPTVFRLEQNYPNPFNPSTTIKYELPRASQVSLMVYDILGREVSVLVNERREAGVHEVKFDGSNLASGVYFYRLQAGSFVQTRKLLLLR